MPDPAFDKIVESMKFVGETSFEGDPICFGPNKTRPLPGGGSPLRYSSDSDDTGKAIMVEGDTDLSGVTGKELMNVASSSSSSSIVAASQDMCNNYASGSSSQHDNAEDTMDEDTDVPEPLPMNASMRSLAKTPMNESGNWRNQEPRLFEDTPEQADISSGLGIHECVRLMELPEEPQHDADPHQVQEPEDLLMAPSTSILTFQVPGFSMDLADGIVSFAEWQSVEDPDDVGLENLDILMNP